MQASLSHSSLMEAGSRSMIEPEVEGSLGDFFKKTKWATQCADQCVNHLEGKASVMEFSLASLSSRLTRLEEASGAECSHHEVPSYIDIRGFCAFDDRNDKGIGAHEADVIFRCLKKELPDTVSCLLKDYAPSSSKSHFLRIYITDDAHGQVLSCIRSWLRRRGRTTCVTERPLYARAEPSLEEKGRLAAFAKLQAFVKSFVAPKTLSISEFRFLWAPDFKVYGFQDHEPALVAELGAKHVTWTDFIQEAIGMNITQLDLELLRYRRKRIGRTPVSSPTDVRMKVITWNAAKKTVRRCRSTLKAFKSNYGGVCVLLQEIPAWVSTIASGLALRTAPHSDCGIAIPAHLLSNIRDEDCGKKWYGIATDSIILISDHVVGPLHAPSQASSTFREINQFIARAELRMRANDVEPVLFLGIDTNTGLPKNFEGVSGPLVCKPLSSHTAEKQRTMASWFARNQLTALNTYPNDALDSPEPTRQRGSTTSQIDFIGFRGRLLCFRSWVEKNPCKAFAKSDHGLVLANAVVRAQPFPRRADNLEATYTGWTLTNEHARTQYLRMCLHAYNENRTTTLDELQHLGQTLRSNVPHVTKRELLSPITSPSAVFGTSTKKNLMRQIGGRPRVEVKELVRELRKCKRKKVHNNALTNLKRITSHIPKQSQPPPATMSFQQERHVADRELWRRYACSFGEAKHYDSSNLPEDQHAFYETLCKLADSEDPSRVSLADVVLARGAGKLNKLHGSDGVPHEVWRELPFAMLPCVRDIFQKRQAGEASRPASWQLLPQLGIPKTNPARATAELRMGPTKEMTDFRWLTINNALRQWYIRSLTSRCPKSLQQRGHFSFAYQKGISASSIHGLLFEILFYADVWKLPLVVGVSDLKTCFDMIRHRHCAESLLRASWPAHVVKALFAEWMSLKCFYRLPHSGDTEHFNLLKSIMQGSTEAGDCANFSVIDVIAPLDQRWQNAGFGFSLLQSNRRITYAVWSDNLFLFASSEWQMSQMLLDTTTAILMHGWEWKRSSLEVMFGGCLQKHDEDITIHVGSDEYTWNCVEKLESLGMLFSGRAESRVSLEHRLDKGEGIYWKHSAVFKKGICHVTRFGAWIETAQTSAAFSLGQIHMDKHILQSMFTWEVRQLRRALTLSPRGPDDLFAFRTRSKRYIEALFQKTRQKFLHERVLSQHFESAANLDSPGMMVALDRSELWWQAVRDLPRCQRKTFQGVQSTTGRRSTYEDLLIGVWGLSWMTVLKTTPVSELCTAKHHFISNVCSRYGLPVSRMTAGDADPDQIAAHILVGRTFKGVSSVDEVLDMTLEAPASDDVWLPSCRQWEVISDCKALVGTVLGRSQINNKQHEPALRSIIENFETMIHVGLVPRAGMTEPVKWRPRRQNVIADAMCNLAMDLSSPVRWANGRGTEILKSCFALQLYTDGGVRDAKQASIGYVLFAWYRDNDGLVRRDTLFLYGEPLDTSTTPFMAELIAMKTATTHLRELFA